jgi:hypothetical protein
MNDSITSTSVEEQTRTVLVDMTRLAASLVSTGDGGTAVFPPGALPYQNTAGGTTGEAAYGPIVRDAKLTLRGGTLKPQKTNLRALTFQGGSPLLERMVFDWEGYTARTIEGVVFHGPSGDLPNVVTTDPTVVYSESRYAPGAGWIGFNAIHERYLFSKVLGSMADAFHSANGLNTLMIGLWADDAGDDAFAFIDYEHRPESFYGHTHAVTARLGQARGVVRGGWSFATTVGAVLDRMRVAALYHTYEATPDYATRVPNHHMTVGVMAYRTGNVPHRQASQVTRPPVLGAFISHGEQVSMYSDLLSDISDGYGMDVMDSQDVYYDHVVLRTSVGIGARIKNARVRIGRLIVEGSGDAGLYLVEAANLEADTVILKNCGLTRPDKLAIVVDAESTLRIGRLIIERDDPNAGVNYGIYGYGQIDDLSWQIAGGVEPTGVDQRGIIRQRQGRSTKAALPFTVRMTAPGSGLRWTLAEAGRIVRITANQEGGASGSALIGYEVYGEGYSNLRGGNPEFAAGGDGHAATFPVSDGVVAGETIHVRWARRFESEGVVGAQPAAMNVTVWFRPD